MRQYRDNIYKTIHQRCRAVSKGYIIDEGGAVQGLGFFGDGLNDFMRGCDFFSGVSDIYYSLLNHETGIVYSQH